MNETITLLQYILFTALCAALLIEMLHYLLLGIRLLRHNRKHKTAKTTASTPLPPVSIIICARNEAENIRNFLPLVLEQDYPEYQVIVVNDGSTDDTEEALNDLQKLYPHLYITNIPEQTRVISHKKLAITIGVKAAVHDILLFTDADCRPWTPHWIESIVTSYTPDTDYVIGYGAYYTSKSILSRMIAYDTTTIAIQYLGMAIAGIPYMAVGRNLSYRKSTFLKNKGFAGYLHLPSGDDDLTINHHSTRHNTAVNATLEAKTISEPKTSFADWYFQKLRHLSASSAYTTKSKLTIAVEPVFRGIFWLALTLALVFCHQPLTLIVALSTLTMKIATQTIIINKVAKYYTEKTFSPITVILLDILLPLITLYIGTVGRLIHRRIRWK